MASQLRPDCPKFVLHFRLYIPKALFDKKYLRKIAALTP
jgi:hypothetical protein